MISVANPSMNKIFPSFLKMKSALSKIHFSSPDFDFILYSISYGIFFEIEFSIILEIKGMSSG